MPEPGHTDGHLDHLFHALLRLHKALLDDERVSMNVCMGVSHPTGSFSSWCWGMRGLLGCVRCHN